VRQNVLFIAIAFFAVYLSVACAERPLVSARKAHADRNKDGHVDWKEIRVYHKTKMDTDNNGTITVKERRAYWVKTKSVVNTDFEKKYDKNGDGYLTWDEGRELLKDKHRIIQTKGRAIVNTDLEAEFDANSDGMIDRSEASAILEAIKE